MVLALDGHDGAGKTTLALRLAQTIGADYVRPFAGRCGTALMSAHAKADTEMVLAIGFDALSAAIEGSVGHRAVVLDRGWLTVSTLVPSNVFQKRWSLWFPSVLLWCDLQTTLNRISTRDTETAEPVSWHKNYLRIYLRRRKLFPGPIIRTDLLSADECLQRLVKFYSDGVVDGGRE